MKLNEPYSELYRSLLTQVVEVIFIKANGEVRPMLCTRNVQLANLFGFDMPYMSANLASHDKRCGIENGNIAVIDLVIGEGRSFNIERVVCKHIFESVESEEQASKIRQDFVEFTKAYKKCNTSGIELDELSNADGTQSTSGRFISTTAGLAIMTPFGVYPKSAEHEVLSEARNKGGE